MKGFLKYISLVAFAAAFSCKTEKMQVVSLENEMIAKSDSLWVYHDSIVELWFYFYANNGADRFAIHNPTGKPVFVDLKNSFIAVDNFKKDFWSDVTSVNANLAFQQFRSWTLESQNPISGTLYKPERIIMIPPKSAGFIQTKVPLRSKPFETRGFKFRDDTVAANWTKNGKKTVIRTYEFDDKTSPSQIRLFLTVSRTEDFRAPMYHDIYFRVANIMEMDARQVTRSIYPYDYAKGYFTGSEKNDRADKHPYKKSWRYYLPAR